MPTCYLAAQCNQKDCDKFCIRKYKMDSLYSAALMTDSQKQHITLHVDADGTDLEQFKQLADIEQNICKFIEEGKNLYLHSSTCGCGKTSWSLRLVEAYFNKIWARSEPKCRVLFISVPRFLLALKDNITAKSSYIEYIKENVLNADLVVWDDISHHPGTDFEITNLLSLIDTRLCSGKSNIYTSNCSPQALASCLEARLASRIANLSTVIELRGSDKRVLSRNQF